MPKPLLKLSGILLSHFLNFMQLWLFESQFQVVNVFMFGNLFLSGLLSPGHTKYFPFGADVVGFVHYTL